MCKEADKWLVTIFKLSLEFVVGAEVTGLSAAHHVRIGPRGTPDSQNPKGEANIATL